MKKIFIFLLLLLPVINHAQTLRWVKLNTFPQRTSRKDDLCFINSFTGWVVDASGFVYKTTNGGYSWTEKYLGSYWLRCVGFTDSLNGFIGIYSVASGTSPLLRTTDGGMNWIRYNNLPNPFPRGLCGIHCVNQNVIYSVGRIEGPAVVTKSTDGGNSWVYLNIDSLATTLVDVHFFNSDSGFITGGRLSKATLLFTSNGGQSWVTNYISPAATSYGAFWKIFFVNRDFGVASFNQESFHLQFVKTTNGGMNWNLYTKIINPETFTQGIGFRNENTGWIGGGANTYETTDGGQNWLSNNFGSNINRIRFYSDTLAYAGGVGFYKYTADINIRVNENLSSAEKDFRMDQNYPNPFNPATIINYEIPYGTFVKIKVYNSLGKIVKTILDTRESAGPHQVGWDGTDEKGNISPSGIYYCILEIDKKTESRKMVLLR